jgi:hypothetical protein
MSLRAADLYPKWINIAIMEISKLPPPLPLTANDADIQQNLLNRLQQLGSITARVLRIDNGQAVLATRLGEITGANALKLKAGDVVQIRLEGDKQKAVLKVSPAKDQVTVLRSNQHPRFLAILQTMRPTTAVVVSQQGGNTKLQLGNAQVSVPLQSQLKVGQLLKVTHTAETKSIELRPVNHQQVLKSALVQLIPARTQFTTDNKFLPLLQILQQSGLRTTSGPDPQPAVSSNNTPPQKGPGVDVPGTAVTTSKAMLALVSGLESLVRSLPVIAALDQRTIQKWVEHASESLLRPPSEKSLVRPNPLAVLHQLPKTESGIAQLVQLLLKPAPSATKATGGEIKDRPVDFDESMLAPLRDAVKATEHSLNQQLFQQTSLRLQQELQQPVAFNLNIPYVEQETAKALKLSIRQKNKVADPEKQAWEIRLSFEFGLLGLISTHILLDGNTLSTNFWAVEPDTKAKIERELPDFRQQLIASGFDPGYFLCFSGKPPEDGDSEFSPLPDSLLDIKV